VKLIKGYNKSQTIKTDLLIVILYALPACAPHVAVVISPLRALKLDQPQRCEEAGMKAAVLQRHSDLTRDDKEGMIFCVTPVRRSEN